VETYRVESVAGVSTVEDQPHTNTFVDVHNKIRAFKDRLREANKGRADLREDRLVRETKAILDKEPNSSRSN
jgi:hypothetical protein